MNKRRKKDQKMRILFAAQNNRHHYRMVAFFPLDPHHTHPTWPRVHEIRWYATTGDNHCPQGDEMTVCAVQCPYLSLHGFCSYLMCLCVWATTHERNSAPMSSQISPGASGTHVTYVGLLNRLGWASVHGDRVTTLTILMSMDGQDEICNTKENKICCTNLKVTMTGGYMHGISRAW